MKGQVVRDTVPVLFWHSNMKQNEDVVIFSYGRLYGEDFQYDVFTKVELYQVASS